MVTAPRSCLDVALGYLGRRAHTRLELLRKLRRKGFGTEEVERVLADLSRRGYVDDVRTAEALVKGRTAAGRGSRRIASELAARGVSGPAAADALATLDRESEGQALLQALARKDRALPARLTPRERSKKLFDHLVRRGFPVEAVLDALRKKGLTDDDLR